MPLYEALKAFRYGTRALRPGDRFNATGRDGPILAHRKFARPSRPVIEALAKPTIPDFAPPVESITPAPEPVEEAPSADLDALRAQAEAAGIRIDRRWGETRLRRELDAVAVETAE